MILSAAASSAPRWDMQYFIDEKDTSAVFTDIVFPSAQRGLVSGVLTTKGRDKPIVLVTSDAGANWTRVPAPDAGLSLFCLDETACWMVGEKGIWFSDEAGRSWKKVKGEKGLTRVFFLTRDHGWALGTEKKLLETKDGGKNWAKVPEAEALTTSDERTSFQAIAFFSDTTGILCARSDPPARGEFPEWMYSEPEHQRERPTLSIMLETHDAGATWKTTTASMFGRISELATARGLGTALGLIVFDRFFEYPSEVYKLDLRSGKQTRVLSQKDFAVSDIAVSKEGHGIAAGFEPPGALAHTPVPGKVRVSESADLVSWNPMQVDYRAVAHRVRVALVDKDHQWIATDTGMILRLVR
jgi:photosystem II stability/assembly factor-like uncharacterized protein